MRIVRHKEDMSPKGGVCLIEQDDMDIIISVTNDDGYTVAVEFCETFGGGGGSPNTFQALQKLFEAMEMDNRKHLARKA